MITGSLSATSATATAKHETTVLQQRILTLLEQLGEASDVELWQASQPEYFPWASFTQALKILHAAGKLQLKILAPGQWIVRSLTFVTPAPTPAKPARTAKPRPGKPPAKPVAKPQQKSAPKTKRSTC
jgi:hypothetical protein